MSDKRKRLGCGGGQPSPGAHASALPRRERIEVRLGACASPETLHLFAAGFTNN